MRIALVGSFWEFSLEESYARAFSALGHEVLRFDFDKYYGAEKLARQRLTELIARKWIALDTGRWLLQSLMVAKPDMIMVFKGRHLLPETLQAIRSALPNSPLINFNPDSAWEKANATRWLLDSIPLYDLHLTWSKTLMERFANAGARRVEYLPFAYDPAIHQPLNSVVKPAYDAVLIGTFDPMREEMLSQLTEFNIAIWGNDWEKAKSIPKTWLKGKAVYGKQSTHLLKRGAVALNFLRRQNAGSHNMRSFEIPATASLMLTDRTPEHQSFFEEGKEIECFGDIVELTGKLRDLSHPRAREANYGRNAYVRIQDETYGTRAARVISLL